MRRYSFKGLTRSARTMRILHKITLWMAWRDRKVSKTQATQDRGRPEERPSTGFRPPMGGGAASGGRRVAGFEWWQCPGRCGDHQHTQWHQWWQQHQWNVTQISDIQNWSDTGLDQVDSTGAESSTDANQHSDPSADHADHHPIALVNHNRLRFNTSEQQSGQQCSPPRHHCSPAADL